MSSEEIPETVQITEKLDGGDDEKKGEEFAYLERGGFSSEMFKIEVRGLPKFYGIGELKKLLNAKLELKCTKVKTPHPGSKWAYIGFHNDEQRNSAIQTLNGYKWKGSTLSAEVAKPTPDPLFKRRQENENNDSGKKRKIDDNLTQDEKLKNSVTDYWEIPYEEQISLKEQQMQKVLMKLGNELWKSNTPLRPHLEELRKKHDGLICDFKGVRSSTVLEGYRNKCEFTAGIDAETGLPTVGYRLGSYNTGVTGVAPVDNLLNTSKEMKIAAKYFQEFIRKSEYPVYSVEDYSGYWRQLTVRQSRKTNELMLIIMIHPQELTAEQLTDLKNSLRDYFAKDQSDIDIASVYFALLYKRSSGEDKPPAELLLGKSHITDDILDMTFRISPDAFFQINTEGANVLYKSALELAAPTPETTVLDICCGTGTIGISFAKSCKQVIGIEVIEDAVRDAKANSEHNSVTNCEWYTGKAEDILPAVLARVTTKEVLAIIDPPRAGLHLRGVHQLRAFRSVKRIIYACCDPQAAMNSLATFGRPASKTLKGDPFIPTAAVAVDMFPHTRHVELLILLERIEQKEAEEKETPDQQDINIADATPIENEK